MRMQSSIIYMSCACQLNIVHISFVKSFVDLRHIYIIYIYISFDLIYIARLCQCYIICISFIYHIYICHLNKPFIYNL